MSKMIHGMRGRNLCNVSQLIHVVQGQWIKEGTRMAVHHPTEC